MERPRLTALVLILLIVPALFTPPVPAGARSNGPSGYNSFGTHDWILKKAIKAAGREARWINVRVALRATDDPDSKNGIDHASGTWWHVYDVWGSTYGGAPEAANVWFRRTKMRLQAGHKRLASKALGILAHIVGDVAQPMHTDGSDREDRVHSSYEQAVDARIGNYSFRYDGRDRAKPYWRTAKVARKAHRSYGQLVRRYDRNAYGPRVHQITERQLRRAANAVADLITSVRMK